LAQEISKIGEKISKKTIFPQQRVSIFINFFFLLTFLSKPFFFASDLVGCLTQLSGFDHIDDAVGQQKVVVDLYCNIGTFGYGAFGRGANWFGWDPRSPSAFKKAMQETTGKIVFPISLFTLLVQTAPKLVVDFSNVVPLLLELNGMSTPESQANISQDVPGATEEKEGDEASMPSSQQEIHQLQTRLAGKF
jgi:hypothetical protein